MDEGNIVIAAGFQGIDEADNITTLGRGGSDTTAVALAAVLKADACEIYTDVDGVYTTDPRVVPEARQVKQISYDEMLELATAGAGVMHNRSIEFAKKFNVPVHVRSSFSDNPGTMIVRDPESPETAVCGAAMAKDEARVTVLGVPDRPGAALSIFSKVAAKNIAMDMIVQNEAADGRADLSFTVLARRAARHAARGRCGRQGNRRRGLRLRRERLEDFRGRFGHGHAARRGRRDVSRLGRKGDQHPHDYHQRDQDFGGGGARIRPGGPADGSRGVQAAPSAVRRRSPRRDGAPAAPSKPNAAKLVARLQRMEKLIIDGIDLDESQARVTFVGLPDMPGLAAQIFDELAEAGIVVDMIVQSIGRENRANISVTVAHDDLEKTIFVAADQARTARVPAADVLPQGGQALGVRRRHEKPYRRGRPHVPIAGRQRHQRRIDQHERGAGERGDRRPRRSESAGRAEERIRRHDGVEQLTLARLSALASNKSAAAAACYARSIPTPCYFFGP